MSTDTAQESTTFHAYVRSDLLPPVTEVTRAMSSRGWLIELDVESFDGQSGSLPVQVDGQPAPLEFGMLRSDKGQFDDLRASLGEHYDQETYREVLRQMELRLSFSGDAQWAREMARTVALLGAGAFENPESKTLLFYGR